jgi:hypothetical protein
MPECAVWAGQPVDQSAVPVVRFLATGGEAHHPMEGSSESRGRGDLSQVGVDQAAVLVWARRRLVFEVDPGETASLAPARGKKTSMSLLLDAGLCYGE